MKASDAAPALPVFDGKMKDKMMAEAVQFSITRVSSFRSPKYGATWRAYVTLHSTGEAGILLFAGNTVRDETFGAYASALEENPGENIGPCVLVKREFAGMKAPTWEIADADAVPAALDKPKK